MAWQTLGICVAKEKRWGGAGRGTFLTLIWMGCESAPALAWCRGFLVKTNLGGPQSSQAFPGWSKSPGSVSTALHTLCFCENIQKFCLDFEHGKLQMFKADILYWVRIPMLFSRIYKYAYSIERLKAWKVLKKRITQSNLKRFLKESHGGRMMQILILAELSVPRDRWHSLTHGNNHRDQLLIHWLSTHREKHDQ